MYLNPTVYCAATDRKQGLTLTWDVFKFNEMIKEKAGLERLTLTWDVFK